MADKRAHGRAGVRVPVGDDRPQGRRCCAGSVSGSSAEDAGEPSARGSWLEARVCPTTEARVCPTREAPGVPDPRGGFRPLGLDQLADTAGEQPIAMSR